jgi:hypothetical protein
MPTPDDAPSRIVPRLRSIFELYHPQQCNECTYACKAKASARPVPPASCQLGRACAVSQFLLVAVDWVTAARTQVFLRCVVRDHASATHRVVIMDSPPCRLYFRYEASHKLTESEQRFILPIMVAGPQVMKLRFAGNGCASINGTSMASYTTLWRNAPSPPSPYPGRHESSRPRLGPR